MGAVMTCPSACLQPPVQPTQPVLDVTTRLGTRRAGAMQQWLLVLEKAQWMVQGSLAPPPCQDARLATTAPPVRASTDSAVVLEPRCSQDAISGLELKIKLKP